MSKFGLANWRRSNEFDGGGKPYKGRDKLYQKPAGATGGPWPQDIRDYYRKLEEGKE